ncbi:helix-turn-helix domain-containing protein [Gallaecimonas pentaromativorans]|uniref:helix-turn-helix domain-containing protein n=1 Tax=Gallaecimonas pentaromativorans TaxID=584787 RepID=UPI003A8FF3EE
MRPWFGSDDKQLPALQAKAIVTVAERRGVAPGRLLRGTGIFEGDPLISPAQLVRLACQAQKLLPQGELGFLVGHHLLRQDHPLANLLRAAPDLRRALMGLARYRSQWQLLQYLRLEANHDRLYLYLQDAVGLGEARAFFCQVTLGLLSALLRLQLNGRQALEISLSQKTPKGLHHYQTHLGLALRFGAEHDCLSLPRSWWQAGFAEADATAFADAKAAMVAELAPLGLLEWLARLQHRHLTAQLGLEPVATLAGLSPASLKRQLKAQGTSFGQCGDQVKKLRALHWLCYGQLPNEVLAQRLGYSDVHNFRRSFKRWTGAVPSVFR